MESIDHYTEYKRIVGNDDGGVPFEQKQYEEYFARIKPMRLNNRIYVSWTNSQGMDCKLIGPETDCFCKHRYIEHKTDFKSIPEDRPILQPCIVKGCACTTYNFVPLHGKQAVKCRCKHFSYDHGAAQPYQCLYDTCSCEEFTTSYTCACGESAKQHRTLAETKKERQQRGHPVGKDTLYKAMGGLTGFSSMLDGYARLDTSGTGPPGSAVLDTAITSTDHPFLRANVHSIAAYKKAVNAPGEEIDRDLAERMSQLKRPGESDLDFYERRYQERQRGPKKAVTASKPDSHKSNQKPTRDTGSGFGLSIAGTSKQMSNERKIDKKS